MIAVGANQNRLRGLAGNHSKHIGQHAFSHGGVPLERGIVVGHDGLRGRLSIELFLGGTQPVRGVLVRAGEKAYGEIGADPGPGNGLFRRELPIKRTWPSRHATPDFIRMKDRSRRGEVSNRPSLAGPPDLVCMADGTLRMIRFAAQEQHDPVRDIDAGIVVKALAWINDAVADEDDTALEVSGRCIEDREVVGAECASRHGGGCADSERRV